MSFNGDECDTSSSDLGNTLQALKDAKDAIELSIALQPRENSGSSDERNDDDKLSLRLGLFVLSDSVCRAVLDAICEHPQITLSKLWTLEHYEKGPEDRFAKSVSQSWYSCWFWSQTTCQKIGLTGIYKGMKWHVASNLVSNILDYGLASYPNISDKTRQRIAAACAIAPQMYCQWRYISSFFNSNTTGKNMFATVPVWLMLTQYLLYPKTSGLGSVRTFNIMKYYLPPDHPLYENQSLWVCLRHTAVILFPQVLLHFLPEPSIITNSNFFVGLDEFLRVFTCMLVKDATAWCIGNFLTYPFKAIYARLANTALADDEHRVALKLQNRVKHRAYALSDVFQWIIKQITLQTSPADGPE